MAEQQQKQQQQQQRSSFTNGGGGGGSNRALDSVTGMILRHRRKRSKPPSQSHSGRPSSGAAGASSLSSSSMSMSIPPSSPSPPSMRDLRAGGGKMLREEVTAATATTTTTDVSSSSLTSSVVLVHDDDGDDRHRREDAMDGDYSDGSDPLMAGPEEVGVGVGVGGGTSTSTTTRDKTTMTRTSLGTIPAVADSFASYGNAVQRLGDDPNAAATSGDGDGDGNGNDGKGGDEKGGGGNDTTSIGGESGPRKAMSTASVSKDERRMGKMLTRIGFGFLMIFAFFLILYSGHVYICALVAFLQLLLFRELVKVRYNTYFHIIEANIPLFRTTQWMWFAVAIFYTYSDFAAEMVKSNTALHHLLTYAQLQGPVSFVLYAGTFVLTIATMQVGRIRFQLNQLCWTIVVLCLTVGQLKYIMHNVYNGLIWFALPVSLVVSNDCFAYFSGVACGRKFIRRPFINLSPNKTWEGFIGGWIFTMIFAWYASKFLARYTWMVCPTNEISFFPNRLECELDPLFHEAESIFPTQIFELLPPFLVKMIPGVVEICSVKPTLHDYVGGGTGGGGVAADAMLLNTTERPTLTNCISGDPTHAHHHFELTVAGVLPVQLHALSLGMFASLVAPFGGFLASGIKRAYGIKDFDSIIPGHGGIMDRMDCQFLMALCTWVHYNTFVKITTVSVPKMIYMYNLMKDSEKEEFLERITMLAERNGSSTKMS